jgi:hypothetical protein
MLRSSALGLAVVALLLGACEPDEAQPPATPQNATAEGPPPGQPPPPPPGEPTAPVAAPVDPNASAPPPPAAADPSGTGEYTLGADSDSYDDQDPAALTDFHGALDPYGSWADDPTYGTVWTPSAAAVGADFQPYVSAGHWVYDEDWVWVSDYPWGWAPFHYGRWVLVAGRGWVWIPGRAYRGAWVVWSVDDGWDYVGWAPAPPLFVWFGGAPVAWRGPFVGPRWVYCPHREVFAPAVGHRIVAGPAVASISTRMRFYAPASPRAAIGPPPARFGFTQAEVPHAAPTLGNLGRAQQFARPSTAQPLGARAPAPVRAYAPAAPAAGRWNGAQSGATLGAGRSATPPQAFPGRAPAAPRTYAPAPAPRTYAPAPAPRTYAPAPAPRTYTPAAPRTNAPARPAPVFRGGGNFGGGHRR